MGPRIVRPGLGLEEGAVRLEAGRVVLRGVEGHHAGERLGERREARPGVQGRVVPACSAAAVSYTHLTLPTICSV